MEQKSTRNKLTMNNLPINLLNTSSQLINYTQIATKVNPHERDYLRFIATSLNQSVKWMLRYTIKIG